MRKEAIEKLCQDIKKYETDQRAIAGEIRELAWKPGSLPEVQRLRSERDVDGRRAHGHKALKPYRRPETGSERWSLWESKRSGARQVRDRLVLLGLLRGRSYQSIERSTRNEALDSEWIFRLLCQYGKPVEISSSDVGNWLVGDIEHLDVIFAEPEIKSRPSNQVATLTSAREPKKTGLLGWVQSRWGKRYAG